MLPVAIDQAGLATSSFGNDILPRRVEWVGIVFNELDCTRWLIVLASSVGTIEPIADRVRVAMVSTCLTIVGALSEPNVSRYRARKIQHIS